MGSYYQPTNSPLLTNGSTLAANLGLYHYTVLTNEAVEQTNIVSRGYHYVALGVNGLPLDSNNDGTPDYLEDANGDGIMDNGESNWRPYFIDYASGSDANDGLSASTALAASPPTWKGGTGVALILPHTRQRRSIRI